MILNSFFAIILTSSIILGLIAGPIGNIIYWTGTSSLAEAISHASIIGFVLYNSKIVPTYLLGVLVTSTTIAILLYYFIKNNHQLKILDIIIQQYSQAMMAIGIGYLYLKRLPMSEFSRIAFGDLFSIDNNTMIILFFISLIYSNLLYYFLPSITNVLIDTELSKLEGYNTNAWLLTIFIMLSIGVGILVFYFGSLLTTTVLLGPPTVANKLMKSTKSSIILSSILSLFIIVNGLCITSYFDIPTTCFIAIESFLLTLLSIFLPEK